jgi:hypothetical protein
VDFRDEAVPKTQRVGFVRDEVQAAGDGAPFLLDDLPGVLRGGGERIRIGAAPAPGGGQIGDLVFHQRAEQAQVAAGAGEDAVLAVGVPAGDAVLEFRRAVEVDFLGALDDQILEDAVAARGGAALHDGRVGAAGLIGARDDAGVGAEAVGAAKQGGIAQFAGDAGGQHEADARNAGEHGVGGGGEGLRGFGAQRAGTVREALVELGVGGQGTLEAGHARGRRRQRPAGQGDDFRGDFVGLVDAVAAQELGQSGGLAAGQLGRAEAVHHQLEGGRTKRCQAAFGGIQKAGAELVHEGVDAVGRGGLLADLGAAAAGQLAQSFNLYTFRLAVPVPGAAVGMARQLRFQYPGASASSRCLEG